MKQYFHTITQQIKTTSAESLSYEEKMDGKDSDLSFF